MMAYQPYQCSSGGAKQLTAWVRFYNGMSALPIQLMKGQSNIQSGWDFMIVCQLYSAQKRQSNSHAGWDFMMAY